MTQLAQTYPQLAVQLAATGWPGGELASVRAAYDLAALLFVGAERGSGKPFIDHLVGTASAVLLGGGDSTTVAAALLHAAYDQGDFGRGRSSAGEANRRTVRDEVGPAVEALVFAYHRFRWSPAAASDAASTVDEASAVERAVLLMRVANEIDDAIDGGLLLSGKLHHAEHQRSVHLAVVELAERIGTPTLARLARTTLLTPPPPIPAELIVGNGASKHRVPKSARRRWRVRPKHLLWQLRRTGSRLLKPAAR